MNKGLLSCWLGFGTSYVREVRSSIENIFKKKLQPSYKTKGFVETDLLISRIILHE